MGTFNKLRRILKSELLFICCLFFGVELLTCQVLPPQNVTLTWPKDFWPRLSWAPPPHSMKNCQYEVITRKKDGGIDGKSYSNNTSWSARRVMEGGVLKLALGTVCNGTESVKVEIRSDYKDLVKDLQCFIKSSTLTNCTWLHATKTSDLRFFYMFANNDPNKSLDDKSQWTPLVECSAYRDVGGIRTGCDLQAKPTQTLFMLLNGTLDNEPVRNTFKKRLLNFVRPPALNWTVIKAENDFIINWIPPDVFPLNSEFYIQYTECGKLKPQRSANGVTSLKLPRLSHCQYGISIQAKTDENETPWTEEKYFSADTDPNAILYAVVIIPLMCAGLAVLAVVCCRKNKEALFPKIPEPRDLISEIFSNNNNKSVIHKLYIPAEEEENCKITLVMDPQTDKLSS
ncbi:granulocyte-macrophage colony-stimulating factor receptor subunit alpha-like [Labrus mixtus]|uniref:granulocyte-macrophage colony-stimulating factor receptor subunit alpha-like n=1 Tax=Labrus mixtus TaxID=508554 RepID=UPI0029BFE30A|nr:granulocyte-macrophage colony-stimulating factor receptor subunit alpha-like [Labrus mixtus]